jgi:hypothetical protein
VPYLQACIGNIFCGDGDAWRVGREPRWLARKSFCLARDAFRRKIAEAFDAAAGLAALHVTL